MNSLFNLNSFLANFINYDFLYANPWIFVLLAIWVLPWKGLALWRAAKRNEAVWFVVFLLLNTIGILEIIYLLYVRSQERQNGLHS